MPLRNVLARFKRLVLITLGLICLVLGIIGYILPGLPGTIWLILAATFFVRSSDVLYRLVINNRLFGNQVKRFLEMGAMLASMWIFSLASIFFAPYGWLFDIPILLLAVIGTIYIISRPTLEERSDVTCREIPDEQR